MNIIADNTIAKNVAKQLLHIKAVTINTKEPYKYVSGILAPIYTDNRLLISHPKAWSVVIQSYIDIINKQKPLPDTFSGTATAAIPHAAVIAHSMQIPMVYVRSSKKEHGKQNLIEGEFAKNSTVMIIEDLVSTGKSIAQNVEAIREAGGIVTQCLAITTSTISAFHQTILDLNITLTTLTDIQTVIQTAAEEGYISSEDKTSVLSFLDSPLTWGKDKGFE